MPFATKNLRKYALQGEQIEIVNTSHYPVLICRSPLGVLFPCLGDVLSDEKVEVEQTIKIPAYRERKKPLKQAEKLQLEYLNSKK